MSYSKKKSSSGSGTWLVRLVQIIVVALLGFAGFASADYWNWDDIFGQHFPKTQPTSTQTYPTPPPKPTPTPKPASTTKPPVNSSVVPLSNTALKFVTWNLCNMGKSKSDADIAFIARIVRNFDLFAVQEVSVSDAGSAAIARLQAELNTKGDRWDYVLSDPTSGEGCERYAYLWKPSKVALQGRGWLANTRQMATTLDREPFMARFRVGEHSLLLANFHAVPTTKNPEQEVLQLNQLHDAYRSDNLVIAGDFNLSEQDDAFRLLKSDGYVHVLKGQKTSLRLTVEPNGNYLSQEYDNIFYEKKTLRALQGGVSDFVPKAKTLADARKISDHLPVWCELKWVVQPDL